MPMGMADVATVLFTRKFLKFDPSRARLAGPRPLRAVGRPRLDAALCAAAPHRLRRHDDRRDQALPPARRRPPAIPNTAIAAGIETTTGPLGQGLANAVGMALAERMLQRRASATRWSITTPMSSPATAA
jgi:transketolase